jgi:hypothetical protein
MTMDGSRSLRGNDTFLIITMALIGALTMAVLVSKVADGMADWVWDCQQTGQGRGRYEMRCQ